MTKRQTSRNFVAIDGEAIDGKYVLLCASNGKSIFNPDELSTFECIEFLFKLHRFSPKGSVFVCFGLNYDANMIFRDIEREKLEQLWTEGFCYLTLEGYSFRLSWIPRKMLEIHSRDLRVKIKIYDVFGFFQQSFVKALDSWGISDPNAEIKRMKTERHRFDLSQREEIERYCLSECTKLVELCKALDDSMIEAGIKLRSYMGAGSVASALLTKEKVKSHLVHDDDWPEDIQEAIYCSYFGARVEQFLQGIVTNVVGYDIRSAYPSEALKLPSLTGGHWRKAKPSEIEKPGLHAIWELEWQNVEGDIMPFPLRHKEQIYWPREGRGFYHHVEAKAARAFTSGVRVIRGFIFEPVSDEKPFRFIRSYYQTRLEAKQAGKASEKAYKLGLNSLYGKLAQGISRDKTPPFRSLFWAGRITAGTRARMFEAAMTHPHGVVSIATDGIVFSGDPEIEESEALGGWERSEYDEVFIAQSGIYRAKKADGTEIRKTRGFFLREIDFDDLEREWHEHGIFGSQKDVCECGHCHRNGSGCARCECDSHNSRYRFVGLGTALMRSDFSVWRTWQPSNRIISLHSNRKFYDHERLARVVRLHPPSFGSILQSERYRPKGHTLPLDDETRELIEGFEQPDIQDA